MRGGDRPWVQGARMSDTTRIGAAVVLAAQRLDSLRVRSAALSTWLSVGLAPAAAAKELMVWKASRTCSVWAAPRQPHHSGTQSRRCYLGRPRGTTYVEASLSSMLCSRWLWRGGRSSSSPNSGLPSRSFLRPVRLSSTGTFVSQGGMAFSEGAFDLATGAAIALLSLLEARQ